MGTARRTFTATEHEEIWRRWRAGESISDIARGLRRKPATIFMLLAERGGIAPSPRKRSARALSAAEREEISRGLAAGLSLRGIATRLGRAPSTISREVGRNGGLRRYRAAAAEREAWRRARRPKRRRLDTSKRLRRFVEKKLAERWSPEQIAGWLALHHRRDEAMQISHEAIYQALYLRQRGPLRPELVKSLRTRRVMRRSRRSTTAGQPRGQIIGAVPIAKRPASANKRKELGHWEGDLISGSGNTHIATLVDRRSRATLLVRVGGKDTASVTSAIVRVVSRLPPHLRRSLTWDRGSELANHARVTSQTGMPVYFCDPQSPWQRGTNENTNGLLRQYFPKGTSLGGLSQRQLDVYARTLNSRPRKCLGFRTPSAIIGHPLR